MYTSADRILELQLLFADTIRRMEQMGSAWSPAREFLADFSRKRLDPLHTRAVRAGKSRYTLSLVGLTNVGKSTLTQALLGEGIAPRKNAPATAIPVEYEYGKSWRIIIYSSSSCSIEESEFDNPSAVAKFLRHVAVDASPEQVRATARILVRGPIALLKDTQLVFADTPGFGAAQLGDAKGTHEQKLLNYLNAHVDEVYFCVSGANGVVSRPEVDFFEKVAPLCSTIVVNKWESTPGKERQEMKDYEARFGRLFPLRRFVFTEAKEALNANGKGDRQLYGQSGLPDLNELIRRRAHVPDRLNFIQIELAKTLSDLQALFSLVMANEKIPWHPTTLARIRKILSDDLVALLI